MICSKPIRRFVRQRSDTLDLFDIIGPVMIGPSSSHTAGAARIGLTARMLLGQEVAGADIGLHGSFAQTGKGHGTDRAIVGGLLGMAVDDPRLRCSLELAREAGMSFVIHPVQLRNAHPNTAVLSLTGREGAKLTVQAVSVGGGNIRIVRLDGLDVDFSGKENTLIVHHQDVPGLIASVAGCLADHHRNIATMQVFRRSAGGEAVMVLELDAALPQTLLAYINSLPDVRQAIFLAGRKS